MLLGNLGKMKGRAGNCWNTAAGCWGEQKQRLEKHGREEGSSKTAVLGQKMFWDKLPFVLLAHAYNLLCCWESGCFVVVFFPPNNLCIIPL